MEDGMRLEIVCKKVGKTAVQILYHKYNDNERYLCYITYRDYEKRIEMDPGKEKT